MGSNPVGRANHFNHLEKNIHRASRILVALFDRFGHVAQRSAWVSLVAASVEKTA